MPGIKSCILETIGNTPVVRINTLAPEGVEVFVKLEAFNPMGSIKDRLARGIIETAERDGSLKPGQTAVEATSGNTGIGLAMVCAQKGYPLVVTMAENFSIERRKLMRFLGARVVLTPASEKGSGMLAKARELAEQNGWFLARQFENEANADTHSQTTAEEILADFAGGGLDYWVSGLGTGGTLKGVARALKAKSPRTRSVACEPDNSAILASGIGQTFRADGNPAASHPGFRPHLMQGWSPDFIPKLAADVLEARLIDEFRAVPGGDALACARRLARQEGIFVASAVARPLRRRLRWPARPPRGSRILAMLPDTGERYLSTALFADVHDEMSTEEQTISDSTSGFRFHGGFSSRPSPVPPAEPTADAVAHVAEIISDPEHSIVMFALEWCEFCWSVRQLFAAAGISYHSVDLYSAEYRKSNWGGEVRKALARRTGSVTIPQIYVGGEHIGGATETLDAFNSGALKRKLERFEMKLDTASIPDAYRFLPAWLHPR